MTAYALKLSHMDDTYQILRAVAVRMEDDSPRNISPSEYQPDPMAGLTITAQAGHGRDAAPTDEAPAYSYAHRLGISADLETIPTAQLAATLATLRRVEAALARDARRYGEPVTFGQLAARVATALRVPIVTGSSGPDGRYTSGTWTTWTPGDAVAVIDGWTAAYNRRNTL